MGARGAERDPALLGEGPELLPTLTDERRSIRERVAAAGTDLDLGRDQLADEMRLELSPLRRFLELLEAVDQPESLGIEERELLLDGHGEVGNGVEARDCASISSYPTRCSSPTRESLAR